MLEKFQLFPTEASTVAGQVDALYFWLIAISVFFATLIAVLILVFALRYRRRTEHEVGSGFDASTVLEVTWTLIPLAIVLFTFFWGAKVYFTIYRPPADAVEYYAVGKQWMWKVQHPGGQREINEMHVPVGVPIKVTMTSEDVIHSFFIPAFRVKTDVLPGRYTAIWFTATKPGKYHLFCTEYCGAEHSKMIGSVTVMEQGDYQAWLAGGAGGRSMAAVGQQLFTTLGCVTCHRSDTGARGPALQGLFGSPVTLATGRTITADETYLRESIVTPTAKVVKGYEPIMPTYQGQISEEGLLQLISYLKSLAKEKPSAQSAPDEPSAQSAPDEPSAQGAPGTAPGAAAAEKGS